MKIELKQKEKPQIRKEKRLINKKKINKSNRNERKWIRSEKKL